MSVVRLDSLQKADPQQLAKFLEGEHPADHRADPGAPELSPGFGAADEAAGRGSRRKPSSGWRSCASSRPMWRSKVSVALHKRLESLGEQSRRAYAGFKGAADMLNQLEPATGKGILENIEKDDPKMALAIRNLMFTFEDLLGVPEAGIRELLGQLDKKGLALSAARRRGRTEESDLQIDVVACRRNVERGHGSARSGAREGCHAGAAGDRGLAGKLEAEGKMVLSAEEQEEYVV